ncbi:hypothetical protein EV421DRAFT_1904830 [Armillaria borealis]|uniref:Uncharacterized protein n=1 Tax=Armillaria borealis TaxID=47425 RepID=A0AA39JFC8_9AGAR|nr:hypothetical protein EV421DRAFT_1904830 [Armillaria borealis]
MFSGRMSSESLKRIVHSAPKSIPIIYDSPDPLTIANIANWEYSTVNCVQVNKDKIADDVLIPTLATGFQDELVRNWYDTNCDDLSKLSIAELATAMRTEFLDKHWALDLRTRILADYQPTSESLSIWSTHLWKESLYLSKSTFTISDERLLDHLETHLNPRLLNVYKNDKVIRKVRDIKKWIAAMVILESQVAGRYQEYADFNSTSVKRPNPVPPNIAAKRVASSSAPPSRSGSVAPQPPVSSSSSAGTKVGIGGITDEMQQYLQKHRGCRKCRQCNVDHMSTVCPFGFPDPATYKGITLADGITLAPGAPFNPLFPPSTSTSTSTATPAASTSTSVNAITASLISSGPVAIISSSTPSSSFAPSNETCIINVLSDDSDDDAENVDKLLNRSMSLPPSFKITVALDSAPTTLTKWVKLKLYDRQKAWSSRTVRAIIAPGLCSDIILGLPFLAVNNLVIDATERSVIDKLSGFNLLQVPSSPSVPTVPDPILARKQKASLNVSTSKSLPFHSLPSLETAFTVQSDPIYIKLHDADVVAAVRS